MLNIGLLDEFVRSRDYAFMNLEHCRDNGDVMVKLSLYISLASS